MSELAALPQSRQCKAQFVFEARSRPCAGSGAGPDHFRCSAMRLSCALLCALHLHCCQVKVQPHSVDFYEAVKGSGREVQSLLTDSLARFSALTEDE